MKLGLASVLTLVFLSPAFAQTSAPPAPVEETQAPEDRAADPGRELPTLPVPTSGAATSGSAGKPAPAAWDVNAPTGAALRTVAIDTDEGSWMDVDVSPDGRTLAFTLLGDIYTMPIGGGTPTRIAEGLAWEVQPRFSPDGRRIAFTSDRGGGDNIWVMNADGSDKRQVTKEEFRLLYQPAWSPDGRFIAAKKHFTTGRSLGTGEVWLYHVSGGGGVLLVKRESERHQKELGEPVFAPGGGAVYYTRNVTPGPIFEYAQDSNGNLFNIERYDLATGEVRTVVSGEGGAVRPTPSPDGRKLAFARNREIYTVDVTGRNLRRITNDTDTDGDASWSPDGRRLVWASGAGSSRGSYLWTGSAAGGAPRQVTFELEGEGYEDRNDDVTPAWSPDGTSIAFSRWNLMGGELWTTRADGTGATLVAHLCLDPDWQRLP